MQMDIYAHVESKLQKKPVTIKAKSTMMDVQQECSRLEYYVNALRRHPSVSPTRDAKRSPLMLGYRSGVLASRQHETPKGGPRTPPDQPDSHTQADKPT